MYGTHEPLLIDTTANGADWSATVGDLIADIAWYDHDEQRAQEFVADFRYDEEIDRLIDEALLLLARPVLVTA